MSRETILRKITAALNSRAADQAGSSADYAAREYRSHDPLPLQERVALLIDRLRDYGVTVECTREAGVRSAIADALQAAGIRRVAVPQGIPAEWLPDGFNFESADQLTAAALDTFDGALTGCTLAIAETGTVVLQSARAQGARRLSLVPDYHLCVVREGQIVDSVEEALERLQATATLPTTFVSGPSATSDIEMTRIKGVHGPRNMAVLIVRSASGEE
jgi:L-lactate dehydrogenase complex protein LldG